MRAVNLLPRDFESAKKGPSRPVIAGCACAVLATVVLAVGYLQASSAAGKQTAELESAQARLAAIPQPEALPATVTALPAERQARVTALAAALATRVAWDRVLREISLVLPDDVWLTSLIGTAPGPDGSGGEQGLHLSGYTYSQTAVARLLARLSVIPGLDTVALNSATQAELGMRQVVQFDIGASLRTTTATPAPAAAPVPTTPPATS